MKLLSKTEIPITPLTANELARKFEVDALSGGGSNLDNITTVLMADSGNFTIADLIVTTPGSGYTVGDIIFMTSVGVNVQATVSAIGLSGEIQDVTFSYMTDSTDFTSGTNSVAVTGGTGTGAEIRIKTMYAVGQDTVDGILSLVPAQDPLVQMSMLVGYMRDILKARFPVQTIDIANSAVTADKIDNGTIIAGNNIAISKNSTGITIDCTINNPIPTISMTFQVEDQNNNPWGMTSYLFFREVGGLSTDWKRAAIDPVTSEAVVHGLIPNSSYDIEIRNQPIYDDIAVRGNDEYIIRVMTPTNYNDRKITGVGTPTANSNTNPLYFGKVKNRSHISIFNKMKAVVAANQAAGHITNYDTITPLTLPSNNILKSTGLTFLDDGRLFGCPYSLNGSLNLIPVLDLSDENNITEEYFQISTSVTAFIRSGCLMNDGRFLGGCYQENNACFIFDFNSMTYENVGTTAPIDGVSSMVPTGDDRYVFAADNRTTSGVYDPIIKNASTWLTVSGTAKKYRHSMTLPNNLVLLIPYMQPMPRIFNLNQGTTVLGSNIGTSDTAANKYSNCCFMGDGSIFVGNAAHPTPSIITIDFDNYLDNKINQAVPNWSTNISGCRLLNDGRILQSVLNSGKDIGVYNPLTATQSLFLAGTTGLSFGTQMPDGRLIYNTNYGKKDTLYIISASDGNYGELFDMETLLSPFVNRIDGF